MATRSDGGDDARVAGPSMESPRSMADYDVHVVPVDVTKTVLLNDAIRRVNKQAAEAMFKDKFLDKQYGVTESKISIVLLGLRGWAAVQDVVKTNGGDQDFSVDKHFPEHKAVVVDGQHRRHVLRLEDVVAVNGAVVKARLYTRKDESQMALMDCLWLGYELNHTAGLVRAMGPVDHVHTGLSFVKTLLCTFDRTRTDDASARMLKNVLAIESGTLQDRSKAVMDLLSLVKVLPHAKTSMRQYANIIAGLVHYGNVYDTLLELMPTKTKADEEEEGNKVLRRTPGIKKFSSLTIWDGVGSEHQLKFRIRAVFAWHCGNTRVVGNARTEQVLPAYIQGVDSMYSFFAGKVQGWAKDVIDVFAMPMLMEWKSVGEYLANQCRSWKAGRSEAWLAAQENAVHYVLRHTPGLKEIAAKETRQTRSRQPTRPRVEAVDAPSSPMRATSQNRRKRVNTPPRSNRAKRAKQTERAVADGAESVAAGGPWKAARVAAEVSRRGATAGTKDVAASAESSSSSDSSDSSDSGTLSDKEAAGDEEACGDDEVSDGYSEIKKAFTPELEEDTDVVAAEAAREAQDAAAEPAAAANLPFAFDGGPPGTFSIEVDHLPDVDGLGSTKSAPRSDFVELRMAKPAHSTKMGGLGGDRDSQLLDLYTDGFRVIDTEASGVEYKAPSVRCGYYGTICLLHVPTDRVWVLEDKERATGQWQLLFKDSMPTLFPLRCANVEVLRRAPHHWARRQAREGYPSLQYREDWESLTSRMPIVETGSGRRRAVLDSFMWLRCLGLRAPHRAFFCLSIEDLEKVHEDTYLLAHFQLNRNQYLSPSNMYALARAEGWFRAKRATLDEAGFCVLEDFARDSVLTDNNEDDAKSFRVGTVNTDDDSPVSRLLTYFERDVPTENYFHRPSGASARWATIVNRADNTDGTEEGNARYTTTAFAMVQNLEMNEETKWMSRARALLDVRILQAAKMLRLRYADFDHAAFSVRVDGAENSEEVDHPAPLYSPDSGGRFLGTGPKCSPQKAHCDYMWYESPTGRSDGLPRPGYFAIVTSSQTTPLWVARASHRLIGLSKSEKQALAPLLPMDKILIPPYSLFFGRGDLTHAGAGFDDMPGEEGARHNARVRYHMYIVREEVPLPDAISFYAEYSPEPDPRQRPRARRT